MFLLICCVINYYALCLVAYEKVGIITFHAAHNYGSMLQAYALQQVILNMGYQCEIINFRTERQKTFISQHI